MTGMHAASFGLNTCKDGSAPGYYPDGGQYFDAAEQKLVTAPRCEGEARLTPSTGFYPYEAGNALGNQELSVPIGQLLQCVYLLASGACTVSQRLDVTITPEVAKDLISEDPFVATALGYVQVPRGAAGRAGRRSHDAARRSGRGSDRRLRSRKPRPANNAYSQGATTTALKTWDAKSAYQTTIEDTAETSLSIYTPRSTHPSTSSASASLASASADELDDQGIVVADVVRAIGDDVDAERLAGDGR